MANYKVVDADKLDADLQTVADAIKAKSGTEEAMEFPSGFASAVESIETGGGGDHTIEDGLITGTLTEYTNDRVESVRTGLFSNTSIKRASFKKATTIDYNSFYSCYQLTSVEIPNVEIIGNKAFYNTPLNETWSLPPRLRKIGMAAFYNSKIGISEIGKSVMIVDQGCFQKCTNITEVTFKGYPALSTTSNTLFLDCTNLHTINVPWAEGAVEGAPWGATNATINYNVDNGYPKETLVGTYMFNEVLTPEYFSVGGISFKYLDGQRTASMMRLIDGSSASWGAGFGIGLEYFRSDTKAWVAAYSFVNNTWWTGYETGFRTITFETEQLVDADFAEWFTSNTTKIS